MIYGQIKSYTFTGGKNYLQKFLSSQVPPTVLTLHLGPQHSTLPWATAVALRRCYMWIIAMTVCFGVLWVFLFAF